MAVTKLVSVADLKVFLGISVSTHDTVLGDILDSMSQFVCNYVDYAPSSTAYTDELYDGDGVNVLQLKVFPVITFTRIQNRQSPLNEDSWDTIDTEQYFVDSDSGQVSLIGGFERGKHNYRVTYTAGYGSIPEDLQQAVKLMSKDIYNNRKVAANVTAEKLKDYAISYGGKNAESGMLTSEVQTLLDPYMDTTI